MVFGYHRTSTAEQHLDRGIKSIEEYCLKNNIVLDEMFTDQKTGKNFNRPDYITMKRMAKKPGDIIILSELDRLGRNKEETLKELRHYKEIGVRVIILEIPTTSVDYSDMDDGMAKMIMETINNMLIEMYATFSHAEMQKRERRQREGIQAKKARGEWDDYGRPNVVSYDTFLDAYEKVLSGQLKPFECMKLLGIKKSTYYRYAEQYKESNTIK